MSKTIKEQRNMLGKYWKVVPLCGMSEREAKRYQRMCKRFYTSNGNLAEYIQMPEDPLERNAWNDVRNHLTNTYLVVDTDVQQIVFYFSICCGLIYSDLYLEREYSSAELSFLTAYRQALSTNDTISAKQLKALAKTFHLENEVTQMQTQYRNSKSEQKATRERDSAQTVMETFPAIELTHFCKNANYYAKPNDFTLKTGVYVFWDCVVPEIIRISKRTAAKYLYLFAADKELLNRTEANHLIQYYQDQLQFQPLNLLYNRRLIKPAYDFHCLSMMQEIEQLDKKKKEYFNFLSKA